MLAVLCGSVQALLPAAASRAQGAAAHSSRAALLSAAPTVAPALATLAAERRRSRAGVAMASVSKGQLVDAISEKAGVSKKTAAAVLGSALDVIVESVANGDRVSLVGFGTFDSKERAAREGRNPQTGEKMQIAGVPHLAPPGAAPAPHSDPSLLRLRSHRRAHLLLWQGLQGATDDILAHSPAPPHPAPLLGFAF